MKRLILVILAITLLLVGCIDSAEKVPNLPDKESIHSEDGNPTQRVTELLEVDSSHFQFIAGWLSDNEIAFVDKDENSYQLKSFNLHSGEIKSIYKEKTLIIDVLIHPSKKFILLHTGNDLTSATVKIIKIDGTLQNEITIASSELAIEWNDLDPTLLLLTAFHEDWSFDLFLYHGTESNLVLLPIQDPFPKWIGNTKIISGQTEGQISKDDDIQTFEPFSGKWEGLNLSETLFVDTYEDRLLTIEMIEGTMRFIMRDSDGRVQSEWSLPYVSNDSEWNAPRIEWISKDDLLIISSNEDNTNTTVHSTDGGQTVDPLPIQSGVVNCSPSGKICLTGENSETLFQLETGEQIKWLSIVD